MHDRIKVPDGDVLIHAGDATFVGSIKEIGAFGHWFSKLPHKHKIFVAGNHDMGFQTHKGESVSLLPFECTYLEDSGVVIDGVKFWGSPWQPWFNDWSFNLPRGKALKDHWDKIPPGTDVLITHTPPYGVLDKTGYKFSAMESVGCQDMLEAVKRVKPRLHIFGHIHEGYGKHVESGTTFLNVASCDARYDPTNPPVVIDFYRGKYDETPSSQAA